jgi:DNA-binding transcriptional MerR regulator
MRIGEVARQAGVNVQTIRFYERRGLLKKPQRLPSGYRDYLQDTVGLVRFIKQAQGLGFTLNEIRPLLLLREPQIDNATRIRTIGKAKIESIEDMIHRLQNMRDELSNLLADCGCGIGGTRCIIFKR